jgi:hypothetical protein
LIDISEGIRLFNEADFFSSHDFFEACWMECDRADRLFFQGMVQISVGCYHLISGNKRGCLSQFKKGTAKLKNYLPFYMDVNLDDLVIKIELLINELDEISSVQELNKLWNKIPRLEIKN